jgi:hypothetical protein
VIEIKTPLAPGGVDRARPPWWAASVHCFAALLVGAPFGLVQAESEAYMLAALTPVALVMDAEVSSATSRPGDRFPLHVTDDVKQDDIVLIPTGSVGEGEVIHAAKAKRGGKAGELILAARFVIAGGTSVRLRSFTPGNGKDRSNAAYAVAVAVTPWAMFVRGGEIVIPAGTAVSAKTAMDTLLPAAAVTMEPQREVSEEWLQRSKEAR